MKYLKFILVACIVMSLQHTTTYSAFLPKININKLNQGIVGVSYISDRTTGYKVLIGKDGKQYSYHLTPNGQEEQFNLQSGNGLYTIGIYEQVSGNKYKKVYEEAHELALKDEKQIYLQSIQNISWEEEDEAVKLAATLCQAVSSDEAKVTSIYNYIAEHFVYDHSKFSNLKNTYLPDIDTVLATRKGICYDFASLFAAMLRSQGIPTKLVKGYCEKIVGYHSWNEVYDAKTNSWYIVDLTYDIQRRKQGNIEPMKKVESWYKKDKEY